MGPSTIRLLACSLLLVGVAPSVLPAQVAPGEVLAAQKVSATEGGFSGKLDGNEGFGFSLACPGDLNGDTVPDLVVGAPFDSAGAVLESGTVYVLYPRRDGTINASRAINTLQGGFTGEIDPHDFFGYSVAALGDVDHDGVIDLAVGVPRDDDGGAPGDLNANYGAVWLLFMNANGSVASQAKISLLSGGFAGPLAEDDNFGGSLAAVGDLDGNGVPDLVVGAHLDDGAGPLHANRGAFWVLLLDVDGSVLAARRHAPASLDQGDYFARSLAALGDLDGDGRTDLAVGASGDDDGVSNVGAIWLYALLPDGGAETWGKITALDPVFAGTLLPGDHIGQSLSVVGDLDHDGVIDLATGADGTGDGSFGPGAVWMLNLDRTGTPRAATLIGNDSGGLGQVLDPDDSFGSAVAGLGDLDADGSPDLAVGASMDDDGAFRAGALWMLGLRDHGWLTLAGGLAGAYGVPRLSGSGSLLGGDPFTLTVSGAHENATVIWLAGLGELRSPFHGGVLVPTPDLAIPGAPSDAFGTSVATSIWPVGIPHDLAVWWQAWIEDDLANAGWSGSNGAQGVTP